MYDLPPRRRISLILVKLGPAHALGTGLKGEGSGLGPPRVDPVDVISRKQKTCSCTSSTTGAAYAASGVWRALGRASHALCLAGLG